MSEEGRIIHREYGLVEGVAGLEQMLEAVFEPGTFRLLEASAVTLVDGRHVRLTVERVGTSDDVLALAERVYDGLSEEEIDEVERISLDRRTFFGNFRC